jgi:Recombinase
VRPARADPLARTSFRRPFGARVASAGRRGGSGAGVKGHLAHDGLLLALLALLAAALFVASAFRARLMPTIAAIRASGMKSPAAIAAELDRQGIVTQRDAKWRAATVRGVLRTTTID